MLLINLFFKSAALLRGLTVWKCVCGVCVCMFYFMTGIDLVDLSRERVFMWEQFFWNVHFAYDRLWSSLGGWQDIKIHSLSSKDVICGHFWGTLHSSATTTTTNSVFDFLGKFCLSSGRIPVTHTEIENYEDCFVMIVFVVEQYKFHFHFWC